MEKIDMFCTRDKSPSEGKRNEKKINSDYISNACRRCDEAAKQLFSRADILAPMIAGTVREVKNYEIEEICNMLSLDDDGITVKCLDGEDRNFIGEAKNIFDRLTEIRLPDGEKIPIRIVFDLEPQGREYPEYPIENRAQYYAARLLSRELHKVGQKGEGYKLYPIEWTR